MKTSSRRALILTTLLGATLSASACCGGSKSGGESTPRTDTGATPGKTAVPGAKGLGASPSPVAATGGGIPAIPEGTSAPPTVAEWSAAADINQANANSKPRDCAVKIVREWMKIHCDGNVKSVEKVEGFNKEGSDFFKSITVGKSADYVARLKKGGSFKMRILRDPQSTTLFVNWPGGSDRPSTVVMNIFAG